MRLLLACLAAFAAGPAMAGGAEVFASACGSCHTLDAASTFMAPSLKGVVGRKVAALADFAYSDALKAKGGAWSADRLDAYLANPQTFAPGNKMFVGAADPADRAAVIAYLKTAQ